MVGFVPFNQYVPNGRYWLRHNYFVYEIEAEGCLIDSFNLLFNLNQLSRKEFFVCVVNLGGVLNPRAHVDFFKHLIG